jgi:hypothetical protein
MKWIMFSFTILGLLLQLTIFYFSFRTISEKYENKGLQSFFAFGLLAASTVIFGLGLFGYVYKIHNSMLVLEVCQFIINCSYLLMYYILASFALSVSNKLNSPFYKVFFWLTIISISYFTFLSAFDNNFYFRPITRVSLLIVSIPYYVNLAKSNGSQALLMSFSFWIVMGYTIGMMGMLPCDVFLLFFKVKGFAARQFLNAIVQIPYIIMFLFFIKGFLCIKKR